MNNLFIQYGPYGTFNHILQYTLVDKNIIVVTRSEKNTKTIHYSKNLSLESRNKFEFALKIYKLMRTELCKINNAVVVYYVGCFLIAAMNSGKKRVLDIRTFSINKNKIKRIFYNQLINFEALFFDNLFVLSDGMYNQLWAVNKIKCSIVPLGAEEPCFYDKSLRDHVKEKIFIYVGTFNDRNIDRLVLAFDKFCNLRSDYKLQLIGRGKRDEIEKIKYAIYQCKYSTSIEYIGEIKFPELANYLSKARIGLSYIPINEKYDNQPPTKTYEYLLSRCFVIASGTIENKKIINESNGMIIDNSEMSLIKAMSKACDFDYRVLNNDNIAKEFRWTNIYHRINQILT
jgi:glycosyltransferase involved in cell wall biosynthesis